MSGSTVPAAVSALWDLAESVKPDDATVIFGEPVDAEGIFLALPWTGDPDQAAISAGDRRGDAGDGQRKESYDIHAEISDWSGDVDDADAKTVALSMLTSTYGFYDALYAAVAADRSLGRVVDKAIVSAAEYTPSSSGGAVGTLRFVIHVDAWRTP